MARQPLLHFLLLGSLLWAADWFWRDYQFRQVAYPSQDSIAQRMQDWSSRHGRQPDAAQRQALIRRMLDERILFREALRLGLHRADPVVLRRLRQDIAFLGIDVADGARIQTALDMQLYQGDEVIRRRLIERMRAIGRGPTPVASEAVLRQRYTEQAERWQTPPRVSFSHIYLRAGEQARARAEALRQRLTAADTRLSEADWPGDPFLLGHHLQRLSQTDLAEAFGRPFADVLWSAMPATGQWSAALQSHYGWHLVRIEERHPARPRPFADVRQRITDEWRRERQAARLQRFLEALRQRYRVQA